MKMSKNTQNFLIFLGNLIFCLAICIRDIGNKEYSLKNEKKSEWYTHEHVLVINHWLDIY